MKTELEYRNLAVDLARISLWKQTGKRNLVSIFWPKIVDNYAMDSKIVGKRTVGGWIKRIDTYGESDWYKSAEDALTLSNLLIRS